MKEIKYQKFIEKLSLEVNNIRSYKVKIFNRKIKIISIFNS